MTLSVSHLSSLALLEDHLSLHFSGNLPTWFHVVTTESLACALTMAIAPSCPIRDTLTSSRVHLLPSSKAICSATLQNDTAFC